MKLRRTGQPWRFSRDERLVTHRRMLGSEPLIAGAPAGGCCVYGLGQPVFDGREIPLWSP